jgi:hypothetical protein
VNTPGIFAGDEQALYVAATIAIDLHAAHVVVSTG